MSHQRYDVTEHMEAVSHERHAVGHVANDEVDEHEGGRHAEHPQQPGGRAAPAAAGRLGKLHSANSSR